MSDQNHKLLLKPKAWNTYRANQSINTYLYSTIGCKIIRGAPHLFNGPLQLSRLVQWIIGTCPSMVFLQFLQ